MSSGWFHRTGPGPGSVTWTPAGATSGPSTPLPHQPTSTSSPSGKFPVQEVNGNPPTDLSAFLGVTAFTVIRGDLTYRVFGTGNAHDNVVIFRQQDLGWDGRYIRTWIITATPSGLLAEPESPATGRPDTPTPPGQVPSTEEF